MPGKGSVVTLIEAIVAVTIVATVGTIAADPIIDIGNEAIHALNVIGRGERNRQVPVRAAICDTFPDDCPPPVEPWVDAPDFQP